MTTHLGIAATAATLQQLLTTGFASLKVGDLLGGDPTVSCIAPERIAGLADSSQLNLFLYNQTRNTGWVNHDLPSRDSRGERTANPPLALDLHFLISAHGSADFHAEVMLGAAMQIFHDTPVLGREAIRAALKPGVGKPNVPKELELAGLADQLEQLRITPLNHTTDDVSRIWSALQTPARPSAAYLVSVVLMSLPKSHKTALPVTQPMLYAVPLRAPRIDQVVSADGPGAPVVVSRLLRISGSNLKAQALQLLINGIEFQAAITSLSNEEILVGLKLPDPPGPALVPEALRAGIATLQLSHPQLMGAPPQPHAGQNSNLAAFVLSPDASFNPLPGATNELIDGVNYRSGKVRVDCSPRIGRNQRVRLVLNEKSPPAGRSPRSYSFTMAAGNVLAPAVESSATLDLGYQAVAEGVYLARLDVDGAVSPLVADSNGRFSGPEVTL